MPIDIVSLHVETSEDSTDESLLELFVRFKVVSMNFSNDEREV